MLRSRFPRVSELIDLIEDRDCSNAYFQNFESRVVNNADMERVWLAREGEFQKLDDDAWIFLKAAAKPYLLKKDPEGRGWSQLISTLNEARGYIYLSDLGCIHTKFIPKEKRSGIETPDLLGTRSCGDVLCEVKTIHVSDIEVRARRNIEARSTESSLTPEFLSKLDTTLDKARSQLFSFALEGQVSRTALIVPNFDDWPGEYKSVYYAEIDAHLGNQPRRDYEVAFFNSRTVFHTSISMKFAQVINE